MIKNSMVPLYQQLSEKIKQQITDGKLKVSRFAQNVTELRAKRN